jgi:hypothetical protein
MRSLRRAAALALAAAALAACERRLIRKEEKPFMTWAEQNWRTLTPKQKADYYEMIDRQKERARKERQKESAREKRR